MQIMLKQYLSFTLQLYLFLQPLQIPLKQSFSLLKVLFHTALIMRILRQLIFALHFLIGVVSEVVLSLLLLLQSRGIIKSGKIVESEVKTIVVVQQVSPKRVYLANHARRCSLGQIFKQLQAFQPNKNSFGLKVLSPDGGRHCSHQIFPHFLLLLFSQQLHHLQRPRVNRLILHMRVVLIDRSVYLQRNFSAVRVFRVENNFEDGDMAAHLVKSRPFIEGIQQFLQFLQQSCHLFRLHFREILQRGQYLLYKLYFGVAVLLHRLLEPLLVLGRHLVELRLVRSVSVFQRKFKQALPVDHHYYYYARMIEHYALQSINILECSRIFKEIIGRLKEIHYTLDKNHSQHQQIFLLFPLLHSTTLLRPYFFPNITNKRFGLFSFSFLLDGEHEYHYYQDGNKQHFTQSLYYSHYIVFVKVMPKLNFALFGVTTRIYPKLLP